MARGIALNIGLNEVDPNHYRDGKGDPWPGTLAACENDARDMAALAGELGYEVRGPLLTSAAHSTAVIEQLRTAAADLESGDIFFMTYSGHGGQVVNTNPDDDPEEDKLDETWCLFDRELLDDELFSLLSEFRSGVRVVLFSDSCHSGTVARGEPPLDESAKPRQLPFDVAEATERANAALYDSLQKDTPTKRLTPMPATVVLLSGCQDHQFSRDGRVNGAFTGALLKAWEDAGARRSLDTLLKATSAGIPTQFDQTPNYSVYCFALGPPLVV